MKLRSLPFVMLVLVSACQSTPEKLSHLTDCPEERPQVCTMIYTPVCATEKDGQLRTYSSDCTACSHEEVLGYQQGMCAKEK